MKNITPYLNIKNHCTDTQLQEFLNTVDFPKDQLNQKRIESNWGKWHYAFKQDKIIAISGCQMFNELGEDCMRVMYRGMQIPNQDTYQGLSRNHFNSIPFRECLPYEIAWGQKLGCGKFFCTTHVAHTNRAMTLLAGQGVVKWHSNQVIRGVDQNIWQINVEMYHKKRISANIYQSYKPIKVVLQVAGEQNLNAHPVPLFNQIEPYVHGDPYPIIDKLLDKHGTEKVFYLSDVSVEHVKHRFPFADISIVMPKDVNACLNRAVDKGDLRMSLEHVDYWFSLPKTDLYVEVRDTKYKNPWFGFPTHNQWKQRQNPDKSLQDIWHTEINTTLNTILIPGLTQL